MVIQRKHRPVVAIAFLCALLTLSAATMGCSEDNSTARAQVEASNSAQSVTDKQDDPDPVGNARATFIELGSERCIPCIKMQAVMKEIQERYGDQVRIVFYDVWTPDGQPYARQYGIRVIPTQVFLDAKGQEYFRHEGYFPTSEVAEILALKGVR